MQTCNPAVWKPEAGRIHVQSYFPLTTMCFGQFIETVSQNAKYKKGRGCSSLPPGFIPSTTKVKNKITMCPSNWRVYIFLKYAWNICKNTLYTVMTQIAYIWKVSPILETGCRRVKWLTLALELHSKAGICLLAQDARSHSMAPRMLLRKSTQFAQGPRGREGNPGERYGGME